MICVQFDPCWLLEECPPLPPGASAVLPRAIGTECSCQITACQEGFILEGSACIAKLDCPQGQIQDGNQCVWEEDLSCYTHPNLPFCRPTLCADQPIASDGTDLRAAGLCLEDPPPEQGCNTECHQGLEPIHPWMGGPELTCTGCHGGRPGASDVNNAHVPLPLAWRSTAVHIRSKALRFRRPSLRYYWNYLTLAGVENFEGGLEWLRFKNPADLRVADQTCGKTQGCHQDRVWNVQRSLMATSAGLLDGALAASGAPRAPSARDGDAVYKWDATRGLTLGQESIESLNHDPSHVGSLPQLERYTSQNREALGEYSQLDLLTELYDKACGNCHLGSAGRNDRYGSFRGSGCSACHMAYSLSGRSASKDEDILKDEPSYPSAYESIAGFSPTNVHNHDGRWLGPQQPHPRTHALIRRPHSMRCERCHFGSNHTTLQYRGAQIDPNQTALQRLEAGALNESQVRFSDEIDPMARYHGLARTQVLAFVDWDNDGLDDIPADIHFQAGMECIDCHTSAEMHNELPQMEGALWSRMDQATEIECVHCHGNLEYRALPAEVDPKNPIKNLVVCPEDGESILDYTPPAECAQLGAGRWTRSKFSGRWLYTPQTKDTVDPQSSAQVYTENASIFHGRANDKPEDGVGPGMFTQGGTVAADFSHLGRTATTASDQMTGGLECYACHSTWSNQCFGCHLRLSDNSGQNRSYDFSRTTGERTLGTVVQAEATYISPLDLQFGINAEGKIAQHLPEAKQMIAHTDAENRSYFDRLQGTEYNVYRHRSGYGLRRYETEPVGLPPDLDGPQFEQPPMLDANAGQGSQPFMPHTTQRAHPRMDCTNCHLDLEGQNEAQVLARFMARPQGFGDISDYLRALSSQALIRSGSGQTVAVDPERGYRFDRLSDPMGFAIEQQTDWCVDLETGFPYCASNHPLRASTPGLQMEPRYARDYPASPTAGPLPAAVLRVLQRVRTFDVGVEPR